MDELEKIQRIAGRRLPGAPHHVWLVLDATTGQNAISQAEMFHKNLGVTGIILTKLDGTAKGGIVVGISRQLGIPVRFIGIGERMDDLSPFDARAFVDAIFTS
jgi:fused signal recognition particle receptor